MPNFRIRRRVDAFVIHDAVVCAPTAEMAVDVARREEESLDWKEIDVATFDARSFVALDSEGVEIESTERGDF